MFNDPVEQLKKQYTGQYVKADPTRPELARFQNAVGQIKTVNMSGRALVEFDQDSNRGWYDIALDNLMIVAKPAPKPEPPKAPAKAPAKPPAAKPELPGPAADKQ